jgi:hypothetical protein
VGLTPLAEGNLKWRDKVPVRLLPIPAAIKLLWAVLHPFSPCLDSEYCRTWDSKEMIWIQTANHELQLFSFVDYTYRTEARISELRACFQSNHSTIKGKDY